MVRVKVRLVPEQNSIEPLIINNNPKKQFKYVYSDYDDSNQNKSFILKSEKDKLDLLLEDLDFSHLRNDDIREHSDDIFENIRKDSKNTSFDELDDKFDEILKNADLSDSVLMKNSSLNCSDDDYDDSISRDDCCKICWGRKKDTISVPCGHLWVCQKCSKHVEECGICRKKCSSFVKIIYT